MRTARSPFFFTFCLSAPVPVKKGNCDRLRPMRCSLAKQPLSQSQCREALFLLSPGLRDGRRDGPNRLRQYHQPHRARRRHGHQYYPGVQWDLRDTPWRYVTVIDVPLSMVVDTFMLPFDAQHGPYE